MGTSDPTLKQLLATARDHPALLAAVQEFISAPAPPPRTALPSLEGLDSDTVAQLLALLRRLNGFPRLRAEEALGENDDFWILPPSLLVSMHDIASRASSHSQLWHAARARPGRGLPAQRLFEDIRAAAYRDRLTLPGELIRDLVLGERQPGTDGEQLVANTLRFIRESAVGPAPVRRGDYEGVFQHITEGTVFAWPRGSEPDPAFQPSLLLGLRRWGTHPLFGLLMHSVILWHRRPFPACNGLMEVACRHAACHGIGMPALALVPLSSLYALGPASPALSSVHGDASFGNDRTAELIELIGLITDSLVEAEQTLLAEEEELALRKRRASLDYRLNHRQVALAHRMIDDPTLTIDVGSYRQQFDVALTTARDDLKRLVELEYCATAYEGKRQVFWPNRRSSRKGASASRPSSLH